MDEFCKLTSKFHLKKILYVVQLPDLKSRLFVSASFFLSIELILINIWNQCPWAFSAHSLISIHPSRPVRDNFISSFNYKYYLTCLLSRRTHIFRTKKNIFTSFFRTFDILNFGHQFVKLFS